MAGPCPGPAAPAHSATTTQPAPCVRFVGPVGSKVGYGEGVPTVQSPPQMQLSDPLGLPRVLVLVLVPGLVPELVLVPGLVLVLGPGLRLHQM